MCVCLGPENVVEYARNFNRHYSHFFFKLAQETIYEVLPTNMVYEIAI